MGTKIENGVVSMVFEAPTFDFRETNPEEGSAFACFDTVSVPIGNGQEYVLIGVFPRRLGLQKPQKMSPDLKRRCDEAWRTLAAFPGAEVISTSQTHPVGYVWRRGF